MISHYTQNTPYEQEVDFLIESFKRLSIHHKIYPIENQGSWVKNAQRKAEMIRAALAEFKTPVTYVDCDARIQQYPELLYQLDCDVAYHKKNGKELLSGTVFFNYSPQALQLLERWIELNHIYPKKWDSKNLQRAIKEMKDLKIDLLPPTYCQIFDLMAHQGKPVIEHFQASRRFKTYINSKNESGFKRYACWIFRIIKRLTQGGKFCTSPKMSS